MRPILVVLVLAASIAADERAPRAATCEVRPLWLIPGGVRSGVYAAIGRFQLEGRSGSMVRSFTDGTTSLVVTGAVEFAMEYSKPDPYPVAIEVAISASTEETKDVDRLFESVDSSFASTTYRKNWSVQVTKNVLVKDRIYRYTLHCWDGLGSKGPYMPVP